MARMAKFFIKDTGRYGQGVFAARDILDGETIYRLEGETMGIGEFIERVNAGDENVDDPLQVGMKTYLDLDELSRTFNHSCDPNAGLRRRSELFAIRDILAGEEITYDYSMTVAPTEWGMGCRCGARNCRVTLGDVLSIPTPIRDAYRSRGAVQTYMKKLLERIDREGRYRIPSYELLFRKIKQAPNS